MSDGALSSVITGLCDCCGRLRKIKLYVLQLGKAAWVCKECRKGSGK